MENKKPRQKFEKTCSSFITCTEEKTVLFTKQDYLIIECKKCGHRFLKVTDPEEHVSGIYSDDYFFAGKDGYPNYLEEKDLLYQKGLRYAKLVGKYAIPGKVLDIGAAAGFILKGFEKYGWICRGIEPNDTMASFGRNDQKLNISTGNFENFETDEKFDLINMIQVIGHFYDLDKALQNTSRILNPHGLVLVESWDMKSVVAKLLGKHWHEYSPPSVVHWFSDRTLAGVFEHFGFEMIAKGHPVKKISARHAFSFLDGKTSNFFLKRTFINSLIGLLGKATLIYPLRDVKWYLFRKL